MLDPLKISRPIQASILLVLVLAAYQPSLHNGFIWDDDLYVTHNTTLRSPEGLKRIWTVRGVTVQYYPMVFTSFWAEYQIFGPEPMVFHATNMMLHGANAVLVWLVLAALGLPWAWPAAAIFALHPVNVESVAWITERKNVLSGLFAFSSLLILIRLYLPGAKETEEKDRLQTRKQHTLYSISLLLFILALLSKSVTSMLPAVILILIWWKQKKIPVNIIYAMLPFFAAGLAAGINTSWMEKTLVGASGPEWDISAVERFLIAGRALWFYAYKLVWPAELIFIYPRWEINASAWWQYLFPLAVLLLLTFLFSARNRIGKGPVAGVALFTVILFPALGFIDYYPMQFSFVADHFQYFATPVLIAMAVAGAHRIAGRGRWRHERTLLAGVFPVLVLTLGLQTWNAQEKYRGLQPLWEHTIAHNPGCWMAYNNLGTTLARQGKTENAVACFQTALAIKPDYFDATNNLIAYYRETENYDRAIERLQTLLKLRPDSSATAYYNLACIYSLMGETEIAVTYLQKAIDRGFGLLPLLERDRDLENIRHTDYYNRALEQVREKRTAR